jgi:hypothetical protein
MKWVQTGGGTFFSDDPDELCSDTQYQAEDGRTVEFVSTLKLKSEDFFPDEMDEDLMNQLIITSYSRQDYTASGIRAPTSVWLFDEELEKTGIFAKFGPVVEPVYVTQLDGKLIPTYPAKDQVAMGAYDRFQDYLQGTDGEGHEEVDRKVCVRAMDLLTWSHK